MVGDLSLTLHPWGHEDCAHSSLYCSQIWCVGFMLWLLSLIRAFEVKEKNLKPFSHGSE